MFHVKHSAPYVYRSASPAAQLPEPTLKMRHRRIFFTLRRETFRPLRLPECPSGSIAAGAYAKNAPPAHFLYAAA